MQYKKDEVKNAILKSAESEFYLKGYDKASIRKIVKEAGTTIGNFYNYFDNKEMLFDELVRGTNEQLLMLISNHDHIKLSDEIELTNINKWREVLAPIMGGIISKFNISFIILIECSQGTKYESARTNLLQVIEEHFEEHIREYNPGYESPEMGRVFAEQLLNGTMMILKNHEDIKVKSRLLVEYILFFIAGTMSLLV